MAYSGFLSYKDVALKSKQQTISGTWEFTSTCTFLKTICGTAMAAFQGDLAEYYRYDVDEFIPEGSLVKFGGKEEITRTNKHDKECFGIISTKPGVILNANAEESLPVALCGKVPCRISGKVKKFDKLTIGHFAGVAKKKTFWDLLLNKPTVAIALEDNNSDNEVLINVFISSALK